MIPRLSVMAASVFFGFIVMSDAQAGEPFTIAQRAVNKLFVKPLKLADTELVISAEPFPADCFAHAITIRVVLPNDMHREVLKVDVIVVADRLRFLAASGNALRAAIHLGPGDWINTTDFLAKLNGWRLIDEPQRPGAKKGYVERRMREPHPKSTYELDIITVVFNEKTGLPVLIGAPPPPTENNCEGSY